MLVTPSFDEIQDDVSPGVYKVRVRKGTLGYWDGDAKTKPYVNWELETFGETESKNNGRRIFYKTSAAGKGAFVLQKFFRAACGEALKGAFDTEQLVGKVLQVEVIDGVNRQTGEKTGYTEIKDVRPVSSM